MVNEYVETKRCRRCRKVFIVNSVTLKYHESCPIALFAANWED